MHFTSEKILIEETTYYEKIAYMFVVESNFVKFVFVSFLRIENMVSYLTKQRISIIE